MPAKYGFPNFDPRRAIEGDPKSPIWIIALNPKTTPSQHVEGGPNPITWKSSDPQARHFQRLRDRVGEEWHSRLFSEAGIAHTDLLKCGSPTFTSTEKSAVGHCIKFLVDQIQEHAPRLLLVLSSDASRFVAEQAKLGADQTEGLWKFDNAKDRGCYVLLSGYSSPWQERYARLRLKRDFIATCAKLGLKP